MGKALLIGMVGTTNFNNRFGNLFGHISNATEANTQLAVSENMTFSGLAQNIVSGGSGTNNCFFRDAGSAGNQAATIAGAGFVEDAVNTDALTTGDLFALSFTDTGSNPVTSYVKCNVQFASGHGSIHSTSGQANSTPVVFDVASATRYIGLGGVLVIDGTTTEADVQIKNRAYSSWEAMQVSVNANARTNDSIFRNRINAGNGSGIVTFGAGVTGLVQDTAVGDSLADGDLLNFSITLDTGVEDLSVNALAATFKSTTAKSENIAQASWVGVARAASSTANYTSIGGNLVFTLGYTDAQARVKAGFAGVASNLRCYVAANTLGGNATLKLMQNGSAVITTTITAAGANQWFENTGDTVSFDADDEFSFEWDEGTSGSMTVHAAVVTFEATGSVEDGAAAATGTGTALFTGASTASAAKSATGTGTASFVIAATNAQAFSMTGTGTAAFVGESTHAASLSATGTGTATWVSAAEDAKAFSMTGTATVTFGGASTAGAALSATGTGTAEFVGLEIQSAAPFSMTGTVTPLFVGASTADGTLSATGTATVSFAGGSTAETSFAATGTGTATFAGAATSDATLSATGTGTATFEGASDADATLSATGTAAVDFVGQAIATAGALEATAEVTVSFASDSLFDATLSATGTATTSFVGAFDAAAQPEAPSAAGGGVGGAAWREHYKDKTRKRRKKKTALEELEELLAQVREQIVPWTAAKAYEVEQADLRALLEREITTSNTLDEIEAEIAHVKSVLAEIDDEEAILLLLT